jgi:chromate transporter
MKGEKNNLTLFNLVAAFFKIGLTAYGMAILQQIKSTLIKKKWLTRDEIDEGLAMVQLYPGPIMYNLGIYGAYKLKGFWGSLFSALFFMLPPYLLMVGLSWLYFNYGDVQWVKPVFFVLEAMVVGIVLHILIDFGKRYLDNSKVATIAAIAFLLIMFKVNALLIILVAIILELILNIYIKDVPKGKKEVNIEDVQALPGKFSGRLIGLIITAVVFFGIIILGFIDNNKNVQLLFSMFKIGAVAFGSGFTIMPLLQQEAVNLHHWITMQQFADGIAFGQITPGPILITATFIGYKVSGIWGSAIATFGMFFPSFFYTLVVTEVYERIKTNHFIKRAIKGVMSAFTGMLAAVVLSLGQVSLKSPEMYIWAVGSFVLVRYFKMNILWIFVIGIAAELLIYFVK